MAGQPRGGTEAAGADAAALFISYASQDVAAAERACAALEEAGIRCWIAPRDIVPGDSYADAIVRAIDAAHAVVLVLSRHAAASPHVLREVERATSKHRPLISLRTDLAALPPALEYFLSTSQWLDASVSGVAAALPRLIEAAKRQIGPAAPQAAGGRDAATPAAPAPAGGATARARSIAVLPFANMSAERDQEYFSDGLAEEIINLLAQIPGLKVIARTSAFAFRGKEQDIRGIAEVLGVTHVLEGSVRRSGMRLRITAQLIDAGDGAHLWSERYDRELNDIFAVQDEIAAAIAGALRMRLSDAAAPRYTPKLEAYEAYLKARHLEAKVSPESLELARRCYEQACALDPAFGLAHVALGHYWVTLSIFGRCPAHEVVAAARAEARRALAIDPALPEAHALLGYVAAVYDMDWAEAERQFEFPLAKQAVGNITRQLYGGMLFLHGRAAEAVAIAQRTMEEDPLDVWARMNLHAYLQAAGRYADALEQLDRVLELDGTLVAALVSKAMLHADRGEAAEALTIARRAYAVGPWSPDTIGVLAALLRRSGDEPGSQSLVQALGSGASLGDARAHALYHLLSGEIDAGADWAERAIEERDVSMMIYLRFVVSKQLRASHRWPKIAALQKLPA